MENNYLPANIRPEDLPSVITQTFNGITQIDKKVLESESRARNASSSTFKAFIKHAGWSIGGIDKKEAIEALQTAVADQAIALNSSIDANKELFENQKKMAQSINYLYGLGIVNMAANRTVVQQLEMKLQNASESELNDFARKEIETVILQLRAQEDIQNRINGHDELLREHKAEADKIQQRVNATIIRLDEMDASISAMKRQLESIENRISDIQERLDNKSFMDSSVFKIAVAVLAVTAIAINLISLF